MHLWAKFLVQGHRQDWIRVAATPAQDTAAEIAQLRASSESQEDMVHENADNSQVAHEKGCTPRSGRKQVRGEIDPPMEGISRCLDGPSRRGNLLRVKSTMIRSQGRE